MLKPLGKALLVEDEALVAMVSEDILSTLGFETLSVATGAEALAAMPGGGFGLAVIDIGLPDMRGDALADRLRDMSPDMPIVVASGYDGAELRRRFGSGSRIAVLSKPYDERDLREAIADAGLKAGVRSG